MTPIKHYTLLLIALLTLPTTAAAKGQTSGSYEAEQGTISYMADGIEAEQSAEGAVGGMAAWASPKHEVRAVWLTTIGGLDWPHTYAQSAASIERQKQELCTILDQLQAAGINTVLLQTRIRGTVIYPSQIEPWDGCFSGTPGVGPGYDPLAVAVEECHRRGMELHAWVVAIPLGKVAGYGYKTLAKKRPTLVVKDGVEGYMDPANAQTAAYIASISREITDRYDIDGIHLDYIRYPETWKLKISNAKARDNITAIVKAVSRTVRESKRWVKLSAAPIGKFADLGRYSSNGWNAYTKGCQDAKEWLRQGYMDQLYPMMYFRANQFYPFAFDWQEESYGRTIVPGLGIYFLSPSEGKWQLDEVERQMNVLRQSGMGYAMFRSKFLTDNTRGLYAFTKDFNTHLALVPPATWLNSQPPTAPTNLRRTTIGSYELLTWQHDSSNANNQAEGGILYNVYASSTYPVDIANGRNLIAQRLMEPCLTLAAKESNGALAGNGQTAAQPTIYYAVTATDRYGNESAPLQQTAAKPILAAEGACKLLPNDGRMMPLPRSYEHDSHAIAIKSLTGQIVAAMKTPPSGDAVNISRLPEGCYMVYSLDKKKNAHRLGFLVVRR